MSHTIEVGNTTKLSLLNMGVFHHEEAPNPSKKCKFLAATLKDVFSNCSTCGGRISTSSPEEEYPTADVDDEQEVLTFHH